MKKICVLVDAGSTAKFIPKYFKSNGIACVHIQSSEKLPERMVKKFVPDDYIEMLVYKGNIDELIKELQSYEVMCFIPGSDSGVYLADMLSEKLCPAISNGSKLSKARRDKYDMIEVVANAGLKTVAHFKSINWPAMENEIKRWGNVYPIVLKAPASANCNNVFIPKNLDDARIAFDKIISSDNFFDEKNEYVILEAYNEGTEYIINTVGRFVAEIWKVNKVTESIVYDNCELLQKGSSPEYSAIEEYSLKVLDALGLQFGAATIELKCRQLENRWQPVLIECGSRVMSGANLAFSDDMFGFNQVSLLVESYLDPVAFSQREFNQSLSQNFGLGVLFISDKEGLLKRDLDLTQIRQLKSFHSVEVDMRQGKKLSKTIDNDTCPGVVYLMGAKEQVLKDYHAIRSIERTGLYLNALEPQLLPKCLQNYSIWREDKFPIYIGTRPVAGNPVCTMGSPEFTYV